MVWPGKERGGGERRATERRRLILPLPVQALVGHRVQGTGQCNGRASRNICYFYPGRKQTAARNSRRFKVGTARKLQAVTSVVLMECTCPSSFLPVSLIAGKFIGLWV